jgi:hypothetical protein
MIFRIGTQLLPRQNIINRPPPRRFPPGNSIGRQSRVWYSSAVLVHILMCTMNAGSLWPAQLDVWRRSDGSAIFFHLNWGMLCLTQAKPEVIKSWLNCSLCMVNTQPTIHPSQHGQTFALSINRSKKRKYLETVVPQMWRWTFSSTYFLIIVH